MYIYTLRRLRDVLGEVAYQSGSFSFKVGCCTCAQCEQRCMYCLRETDPSYHSGSGLHCTYPTACERTAVRADCALETLDVRCARASCRCRSMCIYIYIYSDIEREIERERDIYRERYVYIYIHTHIHLYIYIEREMYIVPRGLQHCDIGGRIGADHHGVQRRSVLSSAGEEVTPLPLRAGDGYIFPDSCTSCARSSEASRAARPLDRRSVHESRVSSAYIYIYIHI